MASIGVLEEHRGPLLGQDLEPDGWKGSTTTTLDLAQVEDKRGKPLAAMFHVLARSRQIRIEPVKVRPIFVARFILLNLKTFAMIDRPVRKRGQTRLDARDKSGFRTLDHVTFARAKMMHLRGAIAVI